MSGNCLINERQDDGCYQGNDGGNSTEWLNLSLGRRGDVVASESDLQSKYASKKIFSCNFCRREFRNSQALGGHQNAHKKERSHYRYEGMTSMIGSPMSRSLGVQPHSLVHQLNTKWRPSVARFNNSNKEIVEAWMGPIDRETTLKWLGASHVDSQTSKPPPELLKIDLDLRL